MQNASNKRSDGFRWLVILSVIVLCAVVLFQWRKIRSLERERDLFQAQATPRSEAVPTNQKTSTSIPANPKEDDHQELLRLRGEVTRLKAEATARAVPNGEGPLWAQPVAIRELMNSGTEDALKQVADLCTEAFFSTNVVGDKFAAFRAAFDDLTERAGNGDDNALRILLRTLQQSSLQGFAMKALGKAGGMGNEKALEPLLHWWEHGLPLPNVVGVLKPAADAGNQGAIDLLTTVAMDQKRKSLWYITAPGLEKAAASGNEKAMDALVAMTKETGNQMLRDATVHALETAAEQNAHAAQALRDLTAQP
jgi:hypothetical protein